MEKDEEKKDVKLDPEYASRIVWIDDRIKALEEHRTMWARAGGVGGRMAMQAIREVAELKEEKARIYKGTQQKIDIIREKMEKIDRELVETSRLHFIKRLMLKKQQEKYDEEILRLK